MQKSIQLKGHFYIYSRIIQIEVYTVSGKWIFYNFMLNYDDLTLR